MKRILIKVINFFQKLPNLFKQLKEVYKYGGCKKIEISIIKHGQILTGKRILITGGSSGIGLSIAKKCIEEGALVVITGRNQKKLETALAEINSTNLRALVWDISLVSQVESYINKAEKLLEGNIDVLINNAGVLIKGQAFLKIQEDTWDKTYAVNSKGLFFLTQSLSNKWIYREELQTKKILNISSQGGFVGATYPYRMTKWDIAGLTQGLGIKLAPFGIIVNGISPGIVATEMQPEFLRQKDNLYCSLNPLERIALPEEIAELAIFLISDAANFIVGQTLVCDGGYSIK